MNVQKSLLERKLSVCHLHETAVRAETDIAAAQGHPKDASLRHLHSNIKKTEYQHQTK